MKMIKGIASLIFGALGVLAVAPHERAHAANSAESVADAQGNLHVPKDYQSHYQFLGSWAVAADSDKGSKEIHSVYASPGAVAQFKKLGHFADGAVLVKEVFEADTAPMTTGTVSRQKTLKGWFVLVKDSKNSHPDSKLWGDGWGWSWFDAPNPNQTTSTDYHKDCQGCHVPAKATDWVYVQGYPPLKN